MKLAKKELEKMVKVFGPTKKHKFIIVCDGTSLKFHRFLHTETSNKPEHLTIRTFPMEKDLGPFTTSIFCKTFLEFLQEVTSEEVTLSVESGLVTFASGDQSITLPGDAEDEVLNRYLEKFKPRTKTTMEAKRFKKAFDYCKPVVGSYTVGRPNIDSILLRDKHMIATDGHRLHIVDLEETFEEDLKITGRHLSSISKVLSKAHEVQLSGGGPDSWGESISLVQVGPWEFYSKCVAYLTQSALDMATPKHHTVSFKVDGQIMQKAMKAGNFQKLDTVVLKIEAEQVVIQDPDSDNAYTVAGAYDMQKQLVIGVNPSFLLQAFDKGVCEVRLIGNLDPIKVIGVGYTAVVMPKRI